MKIFAHRGVSALAPENTESAIRLATEHGADGIEIDVFQHSDEFVVIHDTWLDRTTDGTGHLADHALAQLRQLDAGGQQPIPLLREVFDWIDPATELNIEVKGCEDVSSLLAYMKMHNRVLDHSKVIFSSFNHHIIAEIKRLAPDARIAALTASIPFDYAAFAQALGAEYVNVEVGALTQGMVQDAHARGLKLMAYTVDRPRDLKTLHDWRVDGVFANDPRAARKSLSLY